MDNLLRPSVGACYLTAEGERVEVIGLGTNGIIIEYEDGRSELVDPESWQDRCTEQSRQIYPKSLSE